VFCKSNLFSIEIHYYFCLLFFFVDLNLLAFVSQFIPMEVITFPKYQSLVYHPSLLPIHRGASAINHTLLNGDKKGGFTLFWVKQINIKTIKYQNNHQNQTSTSIVLSL
jgi:hypothetical protein